MRNGPSFCLFLAVSVCAAAPGPIESLVERSPFLPPGYQARVEPRPTVRPAPPAPSAASRLELVGVAAVDGAIRVSLRRRGEQRGTWLAPGESLDDVRYVSFDPGTREARVETGGRRETIPLKPPTVSPMPPTAQRNTPAAAQATRVQSSDDSEKPKIPVRRRVIVRPRNSGQ